MNSNMNQRPHCLTLTIAGVDINDEATDQKVAKQFPDLGWGSCDGVVQVTLICHTADPVQESLQLATRISEQLGATKIRWHDDFVDYRAIARRVTTSKFETTDDIARVRRWHENAIDFPAVCGWLGVGSERTPFWKWADINAWLQIHTDINGAGFQEQYQNATEWQELTEQQIAILNGALAALDA